MKRFLMWLGAIGLGLLILVVALVTVLVVKGRRLDRESKQYADSAILAIASNWNERALLDRASPEFLKACPAACTDRLFGTASRLGPLHHYLGSKGQANISVLSGRGTLVTAAYVARAAFAHGSAEIRVDIIKRAGRWQIIGFHVNLDRMPPASGPGSA